MEARGKEKIEDKIEPEAGNDVETNTAGTEGESKRRQRERKRTRRQVSTGETNMQGDKEDGPEEKDPL